MISKLKAHLNNKDIIVVTDTNSFQALSVNYFKMYALMWSEFSEDCL
jgi:hypothetical protein